MLLARWAAYTLDFTFEAITSRAKMRSKDTYFVEVWDTDNPDVRGRGEVALFRGLSSDDTPDFETKLSLACKSPQNYQESESSAIIFGFETAFASLQSGGTYDYSPSNWSNGITGIPINGLIWMGSRELMAQRIDAKLEEGFKILKLKVGGLNFDDELELIRAIRRRYSVDALEIRLDANGAFSPQDAMKKLDAIAPLGIHSIEQPIRAGQRNMMGRLCCDSPIPIALDEELIGIHSKADKEELLETIHPAYIILKPSLCGGFYHSDEWIEEAGKRNIGWWATSALESNVGLNAIARWLAHKNPTMPQGLGTGALYSNNISSPLCVHDGAIWNDTSLSWGKFPLLNWH